VKLKLIERRGEILLVHDAGEDTEVSDKYKVKYLEKVERARKMTIRKYFQLR
jgi:hypothetical protein